MTQRTTAFIAELKAICGEATQAILEVYDQEERFKGLQRKDDNSPLTEADLASNRIICKGLRQIDPSIPIISEENRHQPWEVRKHWELCWLVDPLDGTKEFLQRNGEFTINIALVSSGKPVLGVVHIPLTGETWWAAQGEGAWRCCAQHEQRVQAATFDPEQAGLVVVCSRSHFTGETKAFVERFKDPVLVSKGSALKFLLIASGQAHVYPRIAPTMEWDTAAAQIIVEEAGGSVVDFHSGKPLRYNKADLLNPPFIARGRIVEGAIQPQVP